MINTEGMIPQTELTQEAPAAAQFSKKAEVHAKTGQTFLIIGLIMLIIPVIGAIFLTISNNHYKKANELLGQTALNEEPPQDEELPQELKDLRALVLEENLTKAFLEASDDFEEIDTKLAYTPKKFIAETRYPVDLLTNQIVVLEGAREAARIEYNKLLGQTALNENAPVSRESKQGHETDASIKRWILKVIDGELDRLIAERAPMIAKGYKFVANYESLQNQHGPAKMALNEANSKYDESLTQIKVYQETLKKIKGYEKELSKKKLPIDKLPPLIALSKINISQLEVSNKAKDYLTALQNSVLRNQGS